jgi:hypothetical protein
MFNEEDVTMSLKEAFVLTDDDFIKLARQDDVADGEKILIFNIFKKLHSKRVRIF